MMDYHYLIESADLDFETATLQFAYRSVDIRSAGASEAPLRLLHFDNGRWRDITSGLDRDNRQITGRTNTFSLFAIGTYSIDDCAIEIDYGAPFTAQHAVEIVSNHPQARTILLANDGNFERSQWQPYSSSLTWQLDERSAGVALYTVSGLMRDAQGVLLCNGNLLSDGIVFDPLPPVVSTATWHIDRSIPAQARLWIVAEDQPGGSGVAALQVSSDFTFRGIRWQPFHTVIPLENQNIANQNSESQLYVRVRDAVGNVSTTVHAHYDPQTNLIYLPHVQSHAP